MWRGLLSNNVEDADVVVFGIPNDDHCSIGCGAAQAPAVIRKCSELIPPFTASGVPIQAKLYDLGDVCTYDYSEVLQIVRLCREKKLTVMLGGDHATSILTQKAFRETNTGTLGIIHIDAHADICDFYNNSRESHACVNRRAIENGFSASDIAMIGIRSFEAQEHEYLDANPVTIFTADTFIHAGPGKVLQSLLKKYEHYDGIYLSFDIDAVDPAYAPGTGTPEAFGPSSREILELITGIFATLPVRMMDIVEIAPPLDVNNLTTWLALKYLYEIFKILR